MQITPVKFYSFTSKKQTPKQTPKQNSIQQNNPDNSDKEKRTYVEHKPQKDVTSIYYPNGNIQMWKIEYNTKDAYWEEFDENGELVCATTQTPDGKLLKRDFRNKEK